jgi:hypothetical protein
MGSVKKLRFIFQIALAQKPMPLVRRLFRLNLQFSLSLQDFRSDQTLALAQGLSLGRACSVVHSYALQQRVSIRV